jgi:hypothetical protein
MLPQARGEIKTPRESGGFAGIINQYRSRRYEVRRIVFFVLIVCLASLAGELRVFSTEGERIALAPVVDLRGEASVEAGHADGVLEGTFGGEMALVHRGTVADEPDSGVWSPDGRTRGFTPYLGPAADHGARAVIFVFIEADGDWSLYLVGVNGRILEERSFTGESADVLPLLTAAAVDGFHRQFPPVVEETVVWGRLLVRCDGRGFTAAVDGNPVGVVPRDGLELRLTSGPHRLTLYDGRESPLETRFVSVVAEGLVVEEFYFGFDVDSDEDDDDTGDAVASCLLDVLFAAFCTPAGSDDDDDGAWTPGSHDDDDDDDDDVWGPSSGGDDDDDDDDDDGGGGDVWAPSH